MEEKTYPFPEFDVLGMLNDLLEKKIIKLPNANNLRKWDAPYQ